MGKRPLGVTIICVLGWLAALIQILSSLASLGLGGFLFLLAVFNYSFAGVGALFSALGIFLLMIGALNFLVIWWLWQMKRDGWKWTIIFEFISILITLVRLIIKPTSSLFLVLIIPTVIIVYLWMKKDLFK